MKAIKDFVVCYVLFFRCVLRRSLILTDEVVMSDLVRRLRALGDWLGKQKAPANMALCYEAADRIEALEADVKALEEAQEFEYQATMKAIRGLIEERDKARQDRAPVVTDEMVERAMNAYWKSKGEHKDRDGGFYMRAALKAALNASGKEGGK